MTDNEIIKALECCSDDSVARCEDCPYVVDLMVCRQMQLRKDSLDLINRQKAENERLEYVLLGVMQSVDKWLDDKELEQDEVNRAATMREKTLRIVETAKAEAIKEFADMLITEKTTAISCDLFEEVVRKSDIDNLVKEKVSEG